MIITQDIPLFDNIGSWKRLVDLPLIFASKFTEYLKFTHK